MRKYMERIARFFLYSALIFLTFIPTYFYIHPIKSTFSNAMYFYILSTGSLALIYLSGCLIYRGFVDIDEYYRTLIGKDAHHCNICEEIKPERAHHCRKCGNCIKKMDHHCHWIGRCINYDNHGHFIRFLFFTCCNGAGILIFNLYYAYLIWIGKIETSYNNIFIAVSSTLIALITVPATSINLKAQLFMLSKNITCIENTQCKNFEYCLDESPYSLGILYNIQEVLGPIYLLFLSNPKGDGIIFKKRYDAKYWPKNFRFNNSFYSEVV